MFASIRPRLVPDVPRNFCEGLWAGDRQDEGWGPGSQTLLWQPWFIQLDSLLTILHAVLGTAGQGHENAGTGVAARPGAGHAQLGGQEWASMGGLGGRNQHRAG